MRHISAYIHVAGVIAPLFEVIVAELSQEFYLNINYSGLFSFGDVKDFLYGILYWLLWIYWRLVGIFLHCTFLQVNVA